MVFSIQCVSCICGIISYDPELISRSWFDLYVCLKIQLFKTMLKKNTFFMPYVNTLLMMKIKMQLGLADYRHTRVLNLYANKMKTFTKYRLKMLC